MSALIKAIKRLEYANFLIKKKATGDLRTFARKMKLSARSVSDLLTSMQDMGANISFDRDRKTYYYNDAGEFCISKFMKYGQVLEKDEALKIGKPEELCFSEKAVFVRCTES